MKKVLAFISAVVMASALFASCSSAPAASSSAAPASSAPASSEAVSSAAASSAAATGDVDLSKLAGKKVAVVRNLAAGDHTQQFLDGCVSEGKSFGFTVDTYVTDGDDAKTQEVVAQCISKGYNGIILSHGQLSYTYDMLKPARDAGIEVVTFDSMPMKGGDAKGELLQGVTSTAQDDQALAQLSLDSMLSEYQAKGGKLPMKVLKTFMGPGIPPLDRRNVVYTKYEQEGKIKTLEVIAPSDPANARGDMTNKTAAILPKYPAGSVDAIWGCYDELAKGVLQALNDAGRTDIPMYTIDVSNDDINLMRTNNKVWRSTAAVDPKLIGIVDMRLLASKFAGVETPDYYNLSASSIKTDELKPDTSMTTLNQVVKGWGDASTDASFNLPWMDTLRKQNSK
ncbi:sugar ABC transporter substrate-binding protein [Acetanaerobacterium elongatum]|uniref:Simple sugar transport system substrate-binding protein n=1 Tax=Acetanaerobacterium elongatum TaxID=258515 RepID=A0A1H0B0P4_9FIRM|nr:sugar ABC transporter substrate-binding protein [Acetanaerobacterium elongatum]SDN39221.1 simple sugar transport system substrate-binding protein [Acetanaerobacterium elongatum]